MGRLFQNGTGSLLGTYAAAPAITRFGARGALLESEARRSLQVRPVVPFSTFVSEKGKNHAQVARLAAGG